MYVLWRVYFENYIRGKAAMRNMYVGKYYNRNNLITFHYEYNINNAYKFHSIEEANIVCDAINEQNKQEWIKHFGVVKFDDPGLNYL